MCRLFVRIESITAVCVSVSSVISLIVGNVADVEARSTEQACEEVRKVETDVTFSQQLEALTSQGMKCVLVTFISCTFSFNLTCQCHRLCHFS